MRIAQATGPLWTKCSKMTEEGRSKKHGMNGSTADTAGSTVPSVKDDCPRSYGQGGRLKFFKDGKFILELERAREGERVSWVSVPRKTYWPPQGVASSTPTYRQESSTSLSVSDDNSSIQSSPWQRDHSWKQTNPRRNASKELVFYYYARKRWPIAPKSSKRRRPYSTALNYVTEKPHVLTNERTENRNSVCNNNSNKTRVRMSLSSIIQLLLEKAAGGPLTPRASTIPISTVAATTPEQVVSPRKRFLREMEKDGVGGGGKFQSLDEGSQKRSRNKATQSSVSLSGAVPSSTATVASTVIKVEGSPVRLNGNTNTADEVRLPRNSSYSITSLLAEDRILRRSPDDSPSHFTAAVTQKQFCSPSPEDPWYSESVDRLRSIELSQVDKRTLSAYSSYPYVTPYMYPYPLPPYYSPALYGRNYMVPPIYPAPPIPIPTTMRPHHHHQRHHQPHQNNETPSCSWNAEAEKNTTTEHRDDNIADMPLNLSKHAG